MSVTTGAELWQMGAAELAEPIRTVLEPAGHR